MPGAVCSAQAPLLGVGVLQEQARQ